MTFEKRRIFARAAATILMIRCVCPPALRAGDLRAVLIEASYAKPVRSNVGGSLFFAKDDIKNTEGGEGLFVGGSYGSGGARVWGGKAGFSTVGNADVRAVVTRTRDHPRGPSANATYLGGEVGWGLGSRFSVGYARRIAGPSTAAAHIVTWGVGLEIPVWR